jgi:hypothetical protein
MHQENAVDLVAKLGRQVQETEALLVLESAIELSA